MSAAVGRRLKIEGDMMGVRLGSWILERELGRGGMGAVYLAHRAPDLSAPSGSEGEKNADAPERAAVKVIAAELAVDPGFLARFQREIDILRQLDHPNIVRFRESGQQNGRPYFIMEYVSGPSFETLLLQRGRLPWTDVLDFALQIAPALKHAHDRGVIHRDLKPSNLLCVDSGEQRAESEDDSSLSSLHSPLSTRVKLTDFGIASLFASPHLTVTGGIVGTAEYLSPEQAAGKPVSRRSDLYSLGVVLYTLATGRTPFVGETLDLLHKHRFGQFERPIRLTPEMPHELDDIICELLEKEPANRPADAMVLFRRLDSLQRKLSYQSTHGGATAAQGTVAPSIVASATRAGGIAEGPATLMGRLMRRELEREHSGGRVSQLLHRPLVLALLFVLTLALIAWSFWPMSAGTMYQRGAALMQSQDPDDWEAAWDKYLQPLLVEDPNSPHRAEIESWREKSELAKAARHADRSARFAGPMSEAQWFYQEGLRLRQQGDEERAKRVWKALVIAFKDVPSEDPWLRRAKQEMHAAAPERRWSPVRRAVQHANELRQQGHNDEAAAIMRALKELYRGDKQAETILKDK